MGIRRTTPGRKMGKQSTRRYQYFVWSSCLPYAPFFSSGLRLHHSPFLKRKRIHDEKHKDFIQFLSTDDRTILTPGANDRWMDAHKQLSPIQNVYLDTGAILGQAPILS